MLFGVIFLAEQVVEIIVWLRVRMSMGRAAVFPATAEVFGAAIGIFFISYILSALAEREKRFKVCCYIATIMLFLTSLRSR
jgi:hypothetical protein